MVNVERASHVDYPTCQAEHQIQMVQDVMSITYRSLVKERPPSKSAEEWWALFSLFLHLTTKEHPCQVYSDSMPLKQIIGQTIMYNGSQVLTAHNTLNGTMSLAAHHISYISIYTKMPCSNLQWSITQSFLPQICIALESVLLKLHAKLASG